MNRRTFLFGLTLGALSAPLDGEAQQAEKVPRVGVLRPVPFQKFEDALRQGLSEQGYVEGRNLSIEWRFSGSRNERFAELATELAGLGVDAILTSGTEATAAAMRATSTIPIVMVAVGDPVGSKFVVSLARPGTNATGLTLYADVRTAGKRLELLKMAIPGASRVAVLWDPTNQFESLTFRGLQPAAQTLGVALHSFEAHELGGLEKAFAGIRSSGVDALYVSEGHLNWANRPRIIGFASEARIPAIYGLQQFAEGGGLMAYSASITDLYRRSATYLARILKGAKPADIPVEQPTKFELVINSKTAKRLGLTIPQSILLRADQVIE